MLAVLRKKTILYQLYNPSGKSELNHYGIFLQNSSLHPQGLSWKKDIQAGIEKKAPSSSSNTYTKHPHTL